MNAPARDLIGGRFEIAAQIGEGGFGVVYDAIDTRFGARVALKRLRGDRDVRGFKREFRSLADILHPNLVRLYELAADRDSWFFTMERVDGVDFYAHVTGLGHDAPRTFSTEQPSPVAPTPARAHAIEPARLRDAFAQLVSAVQALHDARKLHCDLKPSNVLVTGARVVVLDFGLVVDLDAGGASEPQPRGTPGYMAPEQLANQVLGPATDWYAAGAMLFEALTGRRPVAGEVCEPPEAGLDDLATLATELIAARPQQRPFGPDIITRAGGTRNPALATPELVGRACELAHLHRAWRLALDNSRGPVIARVIGASGLGKTRLVTQFIEDIHRDALVLAGRCHEQESLPYKAVDSLIDALAEHVVQSRDEISRDPVRAELIAHIFPLLGRALGTGATPVVEQDSQALRRRAFAALRELIAELSASRPILFVLDDLQWGDIDSARLVVELLSPPKAPRALAILGYRPGDTHSGFLGAFDEQRPAIHEEVIEVRELNAGDAIALARHLLDPARADLAGAIAVEAGGNPLFIQQLAMTANDAGALREIALGEVILAQVAALGDAARELVETVALASRPLDEAVAIQATALDGARAREATLAIRRNRLVTARTNASAVVLEPAHDRVRETIAATLSGERARTRHRRIAQAMLDAGDADPDALVHHFRGAGDTASTRTHALVAAERAEAALAFDRAASHFALVAELSPSGERGGMLARQAEALVNGGRAADAAEVYTAAADLLGDPAGPARAELRRRAAELTLRSGRLELGARRMDAVLRDVGVRPPRTRTIASVLGIVRRLRLFARGLDVKVRPVPPSTPALARLDALWSASTGVSMSNHVIADALGLQHLHEAITLGERSHLIRGLGYESAFEAVIGGALLRRRLANIQATMDRLAAESNDPYDVAWARMSKGVTSYFLGDWRATWAASDAAAALYRERCRGVAWELAICDAYRFPALAYLGGLAELSQLVPRALADARERGDLFAANTLRLGTQGMIALAHDRPAESIDEAAAAIAPFPRETYLLPHYFYLFAVAQADLYRDAPEAALERIERDWHQLDRARLLVVQFLRVEIRHLRARAALAVAARTHAAKLHALALADAAKIERDDVAPAAPLAAAIRAAVAAANDGEGDARRYLSEALSGFEAAGMALYAAATRDRLGERTSGDAGKAMRTAAATWFKQQGVRAPAKMIAMLLPGL